jgi:thiol-disulfide isomerase/thioredoxin
MSDMMTTIPPETPNSSQQKLSLVLLVFLILPLVMLFAAGAMILSGTVQGTVAIPTPVAVTVPPMPTPISLADTPILDFQLTTLDGQSVSLSGYAGRIVFLNFWQTTCPPCERELPAFQAFMAQQPPDGAIVLTVNVAEDPAIVRTFLQERGLNDLIVPMDVEAVAADSYGVFQLPVTFAIDETGIVRFPKYGEITREELDVYVEALSQENS